jgi:hypothetical protein
MEVDCTDELSPSVRLSRYFFEKSTNINNFYIELQMTIEPSSDFGTECTGFKQCQCETVLFGFIAF